MTAPRVHISSITEQWCAAVACRVTRAAKWRSKRFHFLSWSSCRCNLIASTRERPQTRTVGDKTPRAASFDRLVCADHDGWWDGNSKCLGSVEIDDKLEFSCPLDRQIAGI